MEKKYEERLLQNFNSIAHIERKVEKFPVDIDEKMIEFLEKCKKEQEKLEQYHKTIRSFVDKYQEDAVKKYCREMEQCVHRICKLESYAFDKAKENRSKASDSQNNK